MQPDVAKFLEDVRRACELLHRFTHGKSFTDYEADELLRAGVEREFTIIGEALMQASKKDPTLDRHFTALPRIIGFRNLLVHGYATIDNLTVWGVVEKNLPLLKQQVEALLAQAGPP
ncbi:MAG: DUF86 domain-containing protein [Gemmataceae bacterium]|nr:DUF86 domain-containing protein [Gemmataceae bacterium]